LEVLSARDGAHLDRHSGPPGGYRPCRAPRQKGTYIKDREGAPVKGWHCPGIPVTVRGDPIVYVSAGYWPCRKSRWVLSHRSESHFKQGIRREPELRRHARR